MIVALIWLILVSEPQLAEAQDLGVKGSQAESTQGLTPRESTSNKNDRPSWLQFRGRRGQGTVSHAANLPGDLSLEKNLIWKTPIAEGQSSPIIVNDLVFFTGYDTNSVYVLCHRLADGKQVWRREIKVDSFEKTHRLHGPASPSPASDGKQLYVAFGSAGVFAFDLAGTKVWHHRWKRRSNLFGTASSPIVHDETLYVVSGDRNQSILQAFATKDGEIQWEKRKPGQASSWATPVLGNYRGSPALLVYEPFHLRFLSPQDGTEIATVPGLADEPITTPQLFDNLVLVTSYNMGTNQEVIGPPSFEKILEECDANSDGKISRKESQTNRSVLSRPDADEQGDHPLRILFGLIDKNRDGEIEAEEWPRLQAWLDSWKHANGFVAIRIDAQAETPEVAWNQPKGVPECPTPLVFDSHIFAIRNGGIVTSLDKKTGKILFRKRIAPGGPYYASPITADGKIFLASARGVISTISTDKEPALLATTKLGEPVLATPAFATSRIIIRSQKHLWCFGNQD